MILYALKSALVLMLLYTCFFALTSRETFHRLNRTLLVGALVLALVVPFVQITIESRAEAVSTLPMVINREVTQAVGDFRAAVVAMPAVQTSLAWVFWLYFAGFSAVVLHTFMQFLALFRYLRGGLRHTDEFGNTVILHRGQMAPFSVFRFIVMSVDDYETSGAILRHEQTHIHLRHTYDLLLLSVVKAVQWFSPFVWLLERDLRAVHEYEADEAVINLGIDAKQYQRLLVTKTVGNRLQPFANNLRRGSLKKRIIMMYRQKSSRPTMLKALFVVPVTALALCAFATPEVQQAVEVIDKADPTAPIMSRLIPSAPAPENTSLPKDLFDQNAIAADAVTGVEAGQMLFIIDGQVQSEEVMRQLNPSAIIDVTVLKGESAAEVAKEHDWNPADCKGAVIINTTEHMASKVKDEVSRHFTASEDGVVVVSYSDNSSSVSNDELFVSPEVEAQYPGGELALMSQLAKTLRYPTYAMDKNITGQVVLQFVVEKDGSIGPIKVLQSLEERCDAEAILALSRLGKFIPAQHQGHPVRSYCTIPVSFRLN